MKKPIRLPLRALAAALLGVIVLGGSPVVPHSSSEAATKSTTSTKKPAAKKPAAKKPAVKKSSGKKGTAKTARRSAKPAKAVAKASASEKAQGSLTASLPRARPQSGAAVPGLAAAAPAEPGDLVAKAADAPAEPARPATLLALAPPTPVAEAPPPQLAPMPRNRPDTLPPAPVRNGPTDPPYFGFTPNLLLERALDALAGDDFAQARVLAATVDDPDARRLIEWLIARAPASGLSLDAVEGVLETHEGWPEPDKLRLRAEEIFLASTPEPAKTLAFFGKDKPLTLTGRLAFASALAETGQADAAADAARTLWREERLGPLQSARLLTQFGSKITREDNLYRFRRMVLQRRAADAVTQAKALGPGYEELAKAVLATLDKKNPGKGILKPVPASLAQEPLYNFAHARQLRRDGEPVAAARFMLLAPKDPAVIGDGDVWWDERRDLSRALLDKGAADLAYRIVAEHGAVSAQDLTEAEFHAGWYALRFLNSPAKAEPHFRKLVELAQMPRTKARALYWLGRTFETDGRRLSADAVYAEAGNFGGNFYGQLAREKIGLQTTGVERVPQPTGRDRVRFANRDAVRMIRLLASAGHTERAFPFFKLLAETVESPGEVTLTVALARRIGQPRTGMLLASSAEQRGVPVGPLSLPFMGVPAKVPLPEPVDRALLYAVARQESALNAEATSQVGARGLMQLMPTTARATARNIDLPFSVQRLNEPLYNATLGAQYLGELLDELDQSYILTFAGYNAGPGRARQWVRAYGDPRNGQADAVDWIERIPFDETRNYVQKVMENLQVYRSRLGRPLSLSEDLVRGGPEG